MQAAAKKIMRGLTTAGLSIRIALTPGTGIVGPDRFNLGMGVAFQMAKGALAQTGVQLHRQAQALRQRCRSGCGAQQIAAVDGMQLFCSERICQLLGLPAPSVIQRHIELALQAALCIPGRLAMAQCKHPDRFVQIQSCAQGPASQRGLRV